MAINTKFSEKLSNICLEVYEHLGGGNFDEKDYQKALGYELKNNKIEYLREIHLELYYKTMPLKLGAPDFFLNKNKPQTFLEIKLGSGLDDSNRHQLKMYLQSVRYNKNEVVQKVDNGYLINFLKVEPLLNLNPERKAKGKLLYKIELEHFKLTKGIFKKTHFIQKGPIDT